MTPHAKQLAVAMRKLAACLDQVAPAIVANARDAVPPRRQKAARNLAEVVHGLSGEWSRWAEVLEVAIVAPTKASEQVLAEQAGETEAP